jgi:hypothetical protein
MAEGPSDDAKLESFVPLKSSSSGERRSWAAFKVGEPVMRQVPNGVEGDMEQRSPVTCPLCNDIFFAKTLNLMKLKSNICRAHLNTRSCVDKRSVEKPVAPDDGGAPPADAVGSSIVAKQSHSRLLRADSVHAPCRKEMAELRESQEDLRASQEELRKEHSERIASLEADRDQFKSMVTTEGAALIYVLPGLEGKLPLTVETGKADMESAMQEYHVDKCAKMEGVERSQLFSSAELLTMKEGIRKQMEAQFRKEIEAKLRGEMENQLREEKKRVRVSEFALEKQLEQANAKVQRVERENFEYVARHGELPKDTTQRFPDKDVVRENAVYWHQSSESRQQRENPNPMDFQSLSSEATRAHATQARRSGPATTGGDVASAEGLSPIDD